MAPISDIADILIATLNGGIDADRDAIHFARSALGVSDEREIAHLLESDDAGNLGLLELILCPDRRARMMIEPLILEEGLSGGDIEEVAERVFRETGAVTVRFPGTGTEAALKPGAGMLRRYIEMLNMERRTIPETDAMRSAIEPAGLITELRVMIRRSSFSATDERLDFIGRLVASLLIGGGDDDSSRDTLGTALRVFSESPSGEPVHESFINKRTSLAKTLHDAEKYHEMLAGKGMEFLLMQRITPPPESPEALEREIGLIERVLSLV